MADVRPFSAGEGDPSAFLVSLAPATTGRNVIQPSGPGAIPFTIKGALSQTSDLQVWQKSDGVIHARVLGDGRTRLGGIASDFDASFQGVPTNAAHLLANLRGGESGHQYAAVIQTQADTINASNQVEGTFIAAIANHSDAEVPTVIGADIEAFNLGAAAQQIAAGYFYVEHDGTGHAEEMVAVDAFGCGSYGGGTVGTAYGVHIRDQQDKTDAALSAALKIDFQTLAVDSYAILSDGGVSVLKSGDVAVTPLMIRGMAVQIANLQEWQDSSGTALALVEAAGNISIPAVGRGIKLTSPDGLITKLLTIDNAGNLATADA